MYRVIDDYGTNQFCWTWKQAIEWMGYAGKEWAAIQNFWTGAIVAQRWDDREYFVIEV